MLILYLVERERERETLSVFSTCNIRSNRDNFVSLFPVWMFFIPFPCLLAQAKTSNIMLGRGSENWCLFKHFLFIQAVLGLRCGVWASRGGVSCLRARAPGAQTSAVVAHGLRCPVACGIFLTGGGTHVPCVGSWSLNHQSTREVPKVGVFVLFLILQKKLSGFHH